jgi:outer membrane protein TolC
MPQTASPNLRRRLLAVLMLAAPFVLSGCKSDSTDLIWETPALSERMTQIRDHGIDANASRVTSDVEVKDASLDGIVELALANNPEVKAGRLKIERLSEKIDQATALEDPVAALTVGELAQTAAGQVDYIVSLTQALPYPGTLDARKAVAEQNVLVASSELLEVIERVAAEVRRVYWRRYAVARAIEVTEQDKQILKQISDVIDARARVNKAQQADQLRISLRLADLDQELDRLNQQQRSLDAMMNRLLNRRADAPLPTPAAVDWTPVEVNRKALIADAEQSYPAVLVQRRRVEGFRQQFKLAKIERRPDFRFGVQYAAVGRDGIAGSANGDDQFALTAGVSIPFFSDKYDAMEREAFRGIGEALMGLDAAQGRAANLAEDAIARMQSEQSMLNRLKKQMIPDSERTFELSLAGYRAGNESFIQMMDDWQRTLDLQLAAHHAQARYEQARADLAAATGEVSKQQTATDTDTTGRNDE